VLTKDAQIGDALMAIALDDGPGRVDLWPSVRDKALARRTGFKPRAVFRSRLGFAAVIACLFYTSVVVVLALDELVRQAIQSDPGLEYALLEERGQELDLTQTVDGFTVTLQWVYADENRIALAFSSQDPPDTVYAVVGPSGYRLTDDRGNDYSSLIMGRSGPCEAGLCANLYSFTVPESARPMPATLNLQFSTWLWTVTPEQVPIAPTFAPGQTSVVVATGDYGDKHGPFTFEFSVATIPATVIEVNQTVEAADVAMTLKRVTVGLSETRAEICHNPGVPDYAGWAPIFTLDTGTDVDWSRVMFGSAIIEGTDCHMLSFNAPLSEEKGEWTLTVSEIVGFLRGGTGADQHRISGPWVFRFPVR
jgi:hypothetical protein